MILDKRQYCTDADIAAGYCGYSWWDTNTGLAVRYAVVVAFFVLIVIFILGAYLHARRRMRKGLAPLGYHRWLVSRRHYQPHDQNRYYSHHHGQGQAYGMQPWQPPPPAYGQWDAPPQYNPPEGGSKVLANQNIEGGHNAAGQSGSAAPVEYPAPAHPPPGQSRV